LHDRLQRILLTFTCLLACAVGIAPALHAAQEEKPAEHGLPAAPEKPKGKDVKPGEAAKPADGVVLTGRLSRDSARPDGKIRFWITIENKTDGPIRNLHFIDFFTPGFNPPEKIFGGCKEAAWNSVFCGSLPAQQSITIWGDLAAGQCAPRENAIATLGWKAQKQSEQEPEQSGVAQLGEIERLSWWSAAWQWLTRLDIGLPTLTAMLVALFTWWQKRKEAREADEKTERERKDKVEAERRERYQQTWNLMLNQANHFSLRYYIPSGNAIITAIHYIGVCQQKLGVVKQGAAGAAGQGVAGVQQQLIAGATPNSAPAGTNPAPNEDDYLAAFFPLIQIQWLRLYMKRNIGGYYFKDRTAEQVCEGLFQAHRGAFDVRSAERQLTLMKFCKGLKRHSQLDEFVAQRRAWGDDQEEFFSKYFKNWLLDADQNKSCSKDLTVLGAFVKVLSYEANRPFLNWYQEQPAETPTPEEEKEILAIGEAKGGEWPERIQAYLDEMKKGVAKQELH